MVFLEPEQYQQRCAQLFNSYQKDISTLLPFAKIEHIGSSAIPNAISKGDLDIYIEVKPDQFKFAIERLKTLNFIEKQNTLRTHELCMLESLNNDDVAFQIVVTDSVFTFFLAFKNKLINSPTLVNEYNQLKLQCSHLDPDQYRTIKSDFINRVLN
ncbi:GrpB family protein [Acinetobacter pittii]|uniref:GrpB family protein n=1 Tax=Acinetobacter pittii TaxID=48296 RepID=A0A6H0FV02_ACIPI|nr:GrpB family protein [Acinetobacter pittii]MCH2051589.1 GrpB family protein [Acinetobacter pittii]MCU4329668.1 GrpB family protein [Acinetobacter pittii]QIT18170.1 GrpB family protein [Acinetobacter pittii]RSN93212.1 GrpB family protein [Acinetobacter pittii]RSO21266.1 GrpB family protein [Acinetobacter pittii]